MNPNKITASIALALVIGIAASITLNVRDRDRKAAEALKDRFAGNPLEDEFKKIGARYGLNMDFTRTSECNKDVVFDFKKHPVLVSPRNSYDILIVGDSSMAWGIIPEVIEQMTGRSVGLFAMEALSLNKTVAGVIGNMADYYLKPGGLLVLGFGNWTQEQGADSKVLVHTDWMNKVSKMSHGEFAAFIEREKKSLNGGGGGTSERADPLPSILRFPYYRGKYQSVKDTLSIKYNLALFQCPVYFDYIEKYTNPRWHIIKKVMKAKIKCYLRWNNRSLTMHTLDMGIRSKHSEAPADPKYANNDIAAVSAMIKKIDCRKAYLIHILAEEDLYVRLRSIYEKYYKGSLGLIDLGKEHPVNESYPMDEKGHSVNSTGLMESILIGGFLKKNYATLGR